jgi:hypothetical protein
MPGGELAIWQPRVTIIHSRENEYGLAGISQLAAYLHQDWADE